MMEAGAPMLRGLGLRAGENIKDLARFLISLPFQRPFRHTRLLTLGRIFSFFLPLPPVVLVFHADLRYLGASTRWRVFVSETGL